MKLKDRHLVGVGVAACALCCAAPVLGLLGIATVGFAATAATFAFAGLAFAAVVAIATVAGIVMRRRQSNSAPHDSGGCGDGCACGQQGREVDVPLSAPATTDRADSDEESTVRA
jgi:hypothetical protein